MFDGSNESLYHADEENHLHFSCHNCAITNSDLCDVMQTSVAYLDPYEKYTILTKKSDNVWKL